MSFFGKAQKTKTTVAPDKRVESILRGIVSNTMTQQAPEFIAKQFASLDPQEQALVNQYAQSGDLKKAAGLLSPRLSQGLGQIANINNALQSEVENKPNISGILASKNTLQNGLNKAQLNQGISGTGNYGFKGNAQRQSRLGGRQLTAANKLNPSLMNTAVNLANTAGANRVQGLNLQSQAANQNVGLGQQGYQLSNQALGNQLQAGNILQQQQQAQNDVDWQNSIAQAQFPWQQLQNKMNVLNQVSPLAGYTTETKGAAPSTGQQILGGIQTGIGIYGNLGGFNGFGDKTQVGQVGTGANAIPINKYSNQIYNKGGTGLFNGISNWASNLI